MKDWNCNDMTWRANQHSLNSHVHFLLTPLTLLLCSSEPKEWSLDHKQEGLNTVQRHKTGLKQTPEWNSNAGQKIRQQPEIVRCERIILILSVSRTFLLSTEHLRFLETLCGSTSIPCPTPVPLFIYLFSQRICFFSIKLHWALL